MCIVMMLMMFAVHCTWVTSNAYSSPSVVLASTNYDGYVIQMFLNNSVNSNIKLYIIHF